MIGDCWRSSCYRGHLNGCRIHKLCINCEADAISIPLSVFTIHDYFKCFSSLFLSVLRFVCKHKISICCNLEGEKMFRDILGILWYLSLKTVLTFSCFLMVFHNVFSLLFSVIINKWNGYCQYCRTFWTVNFE